MVIDKIAAQKLKDDRYVDDGASGGTLEQVIKMIGQVMVTKEGKFKFTGTLKMRTGSCSSSLNMS